MNSSEKLIRFRSAPEDKRVCRWTRAGGTFGRGRTPNDADEGEALAVVVGEGAFHEQPLGWDVTHTTATRPGAPKRSPESTFVPS